MSIKIKQQLPTTLQTMTRTTRTTTATGPTEKRSVLIPLISIPSTRVFSGTRQIPLYCPNTKKSYASLTAQKQINQQEKEETKDTKNSYKETTQHHKYQQKSIKKTHQETNKGNKAHPSQPSKAQDHKQVTKPKMRFLLCPVLFTVFCVKYRPSTLPRFHNNLQKNQSKTFEKHQMQQLLGSKCGGALANLVVCFPTALFVCAGGHLLSQFVFFMWLVVPMAFFGF